MKFINKILLIFAILILTGCNIFTNKIEEIKFNDNNNEVFIGEDVNLVYSVSPSNAEYDINDISILLDDTFINNGNMKYKATKEGTYNISIVYDNKIYDTRTIVVSPKLVNSISIEKINVGVNLSHDINVDISPKDATNKKLIYSIEDETIAKIEEDKIYGLCEGTTTIIVKSEDGPICKTEVNVNEVHPTQVNLTSKNEYTVDEKYKLNVEYVPDQISNPKVSYLSSNSNIIKIDQDGNLEAVGVGVATITAIYSDEVYSKKEVTVDYEDAISISIINIDSSLFVGNTLSLKTKSNPVKIKGNLKWISTDNAVATVTNDGVVKGISQGEVTITVETENGLKDAIVLNIENKPVEQTSKSNNTSRTTSDTNSSAGMVWLPATGSKYHSVNNCGKMNPNKATQVTEQYAIEHGYGKCSKCW